MVVEIINGTRDCDAGDLEKTSPQHPAKSSDKNKNEIFVLGDRLGRGSFGTVVKGYSSFIAEQVAVKVQTRTGSPSFEREIILLQLLRKFEGFPMVLGFQTLKYPQSFSLTLMGSSLYLLLQANSKQFSLQTVVMLAIQIISLIEKVHSLGIVHRDIKPGNFLMGLKGSLNENKVNLIDFGLAKFYWNHTNLEHYPLTRYGSLVGTARYASLSNHLGYRCSRRDDIVAIGYMILDFLLPFLPWEGLQDENRQARYRKIYKMKLAYPPDLLTQGYPSEFCDFMKHALDLGYAEPPNYFYLTNLMKSVAYRNYLDLNGRFDWESDLRTSQKSPEVLNTEGRNAPLPREFFTPETPEIISKNCQGKTTVRMTMCEHPSTDISVEELMVAEQKLDAIARNRNYPSNLMDEIKSGMDKGSPKKSTPHQEDCKRVASITGIYNRIFGEGVDRQNV